MKLIKILVTTIITIMATLCGTMAQTYQCPHCGTMLNLALVASQPVAVPVQDVVLALPFIVGPFMPKLPPLPHRYSVTNEVGRKYTVEVIDGCEYLDYDRSITHKGNCTNTIHAR